MSLIMYKVLRAGVKGGVVYLPEKAILLSAWADAETNMPAVAFMMKYKDWVEEFPEEANKKVTADNVGADEEEREKDATDVQ